MGFGCGCRLLAQTASRSGKSGSGAILGSRPMETLGIKDMQQLNQGIQQLYTVHNLDTFGIDTLKIIDQLVPADLPAFQSTYFLTRQMSGVALHRSPECFAPELIAVVQQYYDQHPIVKHMEQAFHGAYKISDFISQQEFYGLEGLYQQYLGLFGMEEQTLASFNSLEFLGLSQRETEVLHWLIQGKDNKHIAIQLNIKPGTVRKHLENIYLKLGVQSRTETVAYALDKLGFLDA
jgi:DNA-binding CsgD family transcriptional regulator